MCRCVIFFFFQAEDGIRDLTVTGVQTCALPILRRILRSEGVDDSMIWTEEQSRSTHENATYGAEMLRAKGIRQVVLVTEAYHMLRAEKCFRKEGIAVIAAPCGFRTFDFALEEFLPGWR